MATANFGALNNVEEYFVMSDDIFEAGYNSDMEEVVEDLKSIFEKQGTKFSIDIKYNNEMNYPTINLGYIQYNFNFLNIEIDIFYNIYIQTGYYSDSNLDFSYEIYLNDENIKEYDDAELYDIIKDIEENLDYYNINRGLWAMNEEKLEKKLLKIDDTIREKIKKAFKELSCCQLEKVGGFSNGEAIYREIQD